jgi:signal transduction histidine kinase
MDPVTLDRAFDLFFTTRDQDQGHGLGLPASRRIVETVGGTMTIHSSPGRGTVVTVSLPIRTGPAPVGRLDRSPG